MTLPELGGPTLGAACALASALCWTLIGLLARALSPYLNALSINLVRTAVGGGLLLLVVSVSGRLAALGQVSRTAWLAMALSVVAAFAVGDTAFFESIRRIGLARAMTVSMSYPLLASTLGVGLLGEPVTLPIALGALVTLGGLTLIVHGDAADAAHAPAARARGLALAFGAAAAWAVSIVLLKPPLAEVDPVSAQAVRLPLAALVMWPTPWARGVTGHVRAHLREAGPALLALGVLTAVSGVLFVAALKYAGVTLASVLSSTSPLFALPIGLLAFGERVTWRMAAGTLLCVTGIGVLSR